MNNIDVMKLIESLRTEYLSLKDAEGEYRIVIESVMGILINKYFGSGKNYYVFRDEVREL